MTAKIVCPLTEHNVDPASSGVRIGINAVKISNQKIIDYCLSCPIEGNCLLKNYEGKTNYNKVGTWGEEIQEEVRTEDITVQCFNCKTIETLNLVNGIFRNSKFEKKGDEIFHLHHNELHPCKIIDKLG